MPFPKFSRPLIVIALCLIGFGTAFAVGHSKTHSKRHSCTALTGPAIFEFDPSDTHLKHHGLLVGGHMPNSANPTTVQWCEHNPAANDKFSVDFGGDSPLSDPDPLKSIPPVPPDKKLCTKASEVKVWALSANGADVYKYTLTLPNGTPVDPHIIVVGGSGPIMQPGSKK